MLPLCKKERKVYIYILYICMYMLEGHSGVASKEAGIRWLWVGMVKKKTKNF